MEKQETGRKPGAANSENRGGRPRKRGPEDREHLGFQAPAHLRAQLDAAAAANRRSLSAEAVARLELSFRAEELLGSPGISRITFWMGAALEDAGRRAAVRLGVEPENWMGDGNCRQAARDAVVEMLDTQFLGGKQITEQAEPAAA